MGYIDNTDYNYYEGNDLGGYQFVSIDDIVSQFMVAYVGEEKLISKVNRTDVQFHAYRALAELSFDTFRSFKAQQIDVPPSLTMRLPKDYVNYTKVSWVDSAGIKHPLYPTKHTSNPFQVEQESDGSYVYPKALADSFLLNKNNGWSINNKGNLQLIVGQNDLIAGLDTDELTIRHRPTNFGVLPGQTNSFVTYCYKELSTTDVSAISLSASATTVAAGVQDIALYVHSKPQMNPITPGNYATPLSTVRVGLSTQPPSSDLYLNATSQHEASTNADPDYFDVGYLQWSGAESGFKTSDPIDISQYETVYLTIIGIADWQVNDAAPKGISEQLEVVSTVSGIALESIGEIDALGSTNAEVSSTFTSYKSMTPSENINDDYKNDDYQRVPDERYGLDPAHAQTNGSFYVDQRLGKINFSSNISGKTVILDYISDSLGTDGEMQVHKFAEDAMYKWISYSVLSSKANIPEYVVRRAKKEKFAATRQAKLRLSNIKLEEITQTLRGKSKQIKH